LRIAFLGTPTFALPTLAALREHGHDIAAVYTRAPKPAGRRGLDLTPSPIQVFAQTHGLPVRTPKTLRDEDAVADLAALGIEAAVVVGYGLLLPPPILAVPRHGCLNLHPSLLPRWRGAAPIQRPIMAGDTETAAAIMRMEEGLDTGPVCLEERVPIPPDATAAEMHDTLAAIGARLMVEALHRLKAGTLACRPQAEHGVLYAQKIDKAEARIDWRRPARHVHDTIRGLSPFPGAYFEAELGKGRERIKVLRTSLVENAGDGLSGTLVDDDLTVACADGAVRLLEIQRAGKAPMRADAFLRGTRMPAGTVL
jgi:methionyl-tRNA formyltransferase